MKSLLTAISLGGGVFLSGCAFHEQAVVLDAVGPPLHHPRTTGAKGVLVVYSAFNPSPDFNGLPYLHHCTDYKLLSQDGRLLRVVHNSKEGAAEGPLPVELPVGKYRVIAQADAYVTVTVPVVILAGQTTPVHLEGSPAWPDRAALRRSNPVRLPDGEIAGRRAGAEGL